MSALYALSDMLSEMQRELAMREWGDDVFDRIPRAIEFRTKLFDAILDYARERNSSKVPS